MNHDLAQPVVVSLLNRILRLLSRSLPMYLVEARPWSGGDTSRAQSALARLAADQQRLARRVAEAIARHGGQPEPGPFPSEFGSLNDVDLAYLLGEILRQLRADAEVLQHCADELAIAPDARALAEEVLGSTQAHIDMLEEIVA